MVNTNTQTKAPNSVRRRRRPRNGSGSYTLPSPSLSPDGHDDRRAHERRCRPDIGAALTASTAADGQTPITYNWNWGGYHLQSGDDHHGRGDGRDDADRGQRRHRHQGGLTVTAGAAWDRERGRHGGGSATAPFPARSGSRDAVLVSGVTVTAGGVIVAADGATITGNSTVTGT